MAKESMKARERKRERLVVRYSKKRAELTKVLKSTSESEDIQAAKWDAMIAIQKLPANSSKIRVHNRCGLTGRPRGYMPPSVRLKRSIQCWRSPVVISWSCCLG